MARPVIALLTDFGTADHYVASMKGVMLGICPDATLVDITHEVPPQDVVAGALLVEACHRDFPAGTVFLAVVDPGVGSARRAIAGQAGGRVFVAPDNGLLALVIRASESDRVVEIAEPAFARTVRSRTFEGRDRFAPAAAHLAAGVDLERLGPRVTAVTGLAVPAPSVGGGAVEGQVLLVDRFGNLITNIGADLLDRWASVERLEVALEAFGPVPIVGTYADTSVGALVALVGSTGRIEISVNRGSAAASTGLGRGARVTVRPGSAGASLPGGVGAR